MSHYLGNDSSGSKEAVTMLEQGSSTLAADVDGRVLDRLAGLEKIISPEAVK